MKEEFTLEEAAEFLGCSEQTIRRRLLSGQYHARKEDSPTGVRWLIPAKELTSAPTATKGDGLETPLALPELQNNIADINPAASTQEFATQAKTSQETLTEQQKESLEQIRKQIAGMELQLKGLQNEHYTLVDQKIRQMMETRKQEAEKPKSWLQRFLGQ